MRDGEEAPHRLIVFYRLYAFESNAIFPEKLVLRSSREPTFRDPFDLTEI